MTVPAKKGHDACRSPHDCTMTLPMCRLDCMLHVSQRPSRKRLEFHAQDRHSAASRRIDMARLASR